MLLRIHIIVCLPLALVIPYKNTKPFDWTAWRPEEIYSCHVLIRTGGLHMCVRVCVSIDVSVCAFMSLVFFLFFVPVRFVCVCVCLSVCVYISLLCASKPFWPLCTPQAVSTALELLNSGPACSDCSTIHKHRGVFSLAEYKKYNFWPVIPTSPIFFNIDVFFFKLL